MFLQWKKESSVEPLVEPLSLIEGFEYRPWAYLPGVGLFPSKLVKL